MEIINSKHIKAAEGKVLQRTTDGMIFGNEAFLGQRILEDGTYVDDLPTDFIEIDEPSGGTPDMESMEEIA